MCHRSVEGGRGNSHTHRLGVGRRPNSPRIGGVPDRTLVRPEPVSDSEFSQCSSDPKPIRFSLVPFSQSLRAAAMLQPRVQASAASEQSAEFEGGISVLGGPALDVTWHWLLRSDLSGLGPRCTCPDQPKRPPPLDQLPILTPTRGPEQLPALAGERSRSYTRTAIPLSRQAQPIMWWTRPHQSCRSRY